MAMLLGSVATTALSAPIMAPRAAAAQVRFPKLTMSEEMKEETTVMDTTGMAGVVAPTGGAASEPPAMPKPRRLAAWNPKELGVPSFLPKEAELFTQQFVPEYLQFGPKYLEAFPAGTLPGCIGFDPWALTVLAKPELSVDALQALDKKSRTAKERNEQMLALTPEEQQEKITWMRNSELKHGRLAMLAVAGWPMAELLNGRFLHDSYTNGRAPSLFNGHLPDYLPFLVVALGGFTALEVLTKDSVKDGDYGFDPLGFGSGIGSMRTLQTAEVKHGRAAMMGITGFAVQECLYGTPVVEQTPFFFLPLGGFTG